MLQHLKRRSEILRTEEAFGAGGRVRAAPREVIVISDVVRVVEGADTAVPVERWIPAIVLFNVPEESVEVYKFLVTLITLTSIGGETVLCVTFHGNSTTQSLGTNDTLLAGIFHVLLE